MKVTFKNRPCEIESMDMPFNHDYHCDGFIEEAFWLDTKKDLDGDELDEMNDVLHSGDVTWIEDWLY